jgi:hypothetical protein
MTIPTPQEVHNLIARLRRNPEFIGNIEEAAAALSAYQQEVERLRERVRWFESSGGVAVHTRVFQEIAKREAAEARVRELEQERDAFWQMVTAGWDIEDRAYFESKAKAMGYGSPEAMAAHHVWKRDPRVEQARQSAFAEAAHEVRLEMSAYTRVHPSSQRLEALAARLLAKAATSIHAEEPTP